MKKLEYDAKRKEIFNNPKYSVKTKFELLAVLDEKRKQQAENIGKKR